MNKMRQFVYCRRFKILFQHIFLIIGQNEIVLCYIIDTDKWFDRSNEEREGKEKGKEQRKCYLREEGIVELDFATRAHNEAKSETLTSRAQAIVEWKNDELAAHDYRTRIKGLLAQVKDELTPKGWVRAHLRMKN